jgi:hypothetical protein
VRLVPWPRALAAVGHERLRDHVHEGAVVVVQRTHLLEAGPQGGLQDLL